MRWTSSTKLTNDETNKMKKWWNWRWRVDPGRTSETIYLAIYLPTYLNSRSADSAIESIAANENQHLPAINPLGTETRSIDLTEDRNSHSWESYWERERTFKISKARSTPRFPTSFPWQFERFSPITAGRTELLCTLPENKCSPQFLSGFCSFGTWYLHLLMSLERLREISFD